MDEKFNLTFGWVGIDHKLRREFSLKFSFYCPPLKSRPDVNQSRFASTPPPFLLPPPCHTDSSSEERVFINMVQEEGRAEGEGGGDDVIYERGLK